MSKGKGGFIKLEHSLMDSEAWLTASLGCRCVVLAIWRRHNGKNNGAIVYGARDARRDLGCGPAQAIRYLKEAEERGFIVPVTRGSFDWKQGARAAKATTWRVIMEPHKKRGPANDWRSWSGPENLNDGYRSDNRTVTGAVTNSPDGYRSDNRQPPSDGYRSGNTSKISSVPGASNQQQAERRR